MKYFLLGAFSSAFFLYGSRCSTATPARWTSRHRRRLHGTAGRQGLLLIGVALLMVGLLFKVGAVPFHMWTPDVYQGSPTPSPASWPPAVKVAAFGALLRVMYVASAVPAGTGSR
jgi:NADH-quinone oxidoreductase subunit N